MSDAIVMAALNGARKTKADHPRLPMTAVELAAESRRVQKAGATAVHVHARDADGKHSLDPGLVREIIDEIEHATEGGVVIQVTSERGPDHTRRDILRMLEAVQPEATSIAIVDLFPEDLDDDAPLKVLTDLTPKAWIQYILYRPDDVSRLGDLIANGHLPLARTPRPLDVMLVLGKFADDQQASPDDLAPFLEALDALRIDAPIRWMTCSFGDREHEIAAHVLGAGGNVRIGFENNLRLPDGEPASNNADLVGLAAAAAADQNRNVLSGDALRATWETDEER